MEEFKKMALVPADFASAERHQPVKNQLNKLDEQMTRIVNSNAAADVKFKLYNHILRQHNEMGDQMKKPQKIVIKNEGREPRIKHELPRQRMTSEVPSSKRAHAKKLVEHLESSDIEFNTENELIFNGKTIDGSNMIDLFDHATRDRVRTAPIGWDYFKIKLRETNVPRDAIGNRNVKIYERARDIDDIQFGDSPVNWTPLYK
ncbi:MAG: hypothetical protein GY816_12060 [Cytophagales bacterium]|nr:hypothetical protein [Cytophagales bacterium]